MNAEAPESPVDSVVNSSWFRERAVAARDSSTGHLSCCLVRLDREERWDLEGGYVGPAASVVKVPILVELLARAEQGRLELDERVRLRDEDCVGGAGILFELHEGIELTLLDLGILMTVISDNTASNMLIDRLGLDAINERMQIIGMPDSILGRKFMIDPNALHAKNFTTANDMATCLARLYRGELLGSEATRRCIDILKRQQYREKIPLHLPEDLPVAHKTGEISGTRHDVALVLLDDHPYVLTCLTWGLADVLAGDRAIAALSRDIYEAITKGASPK